MPGWTIYDEVSAVDLVVVPAIDFDPSVTEMIPFERRFQLHSPELPSAQRVARRRTACRSSTPTPFERRAAFVARFAERRTSSSGRPPPVLLDEVDRFV
jgi:hypothetical protein